MPGSKVAGAGLSTQTHRFNPRPADMGFMVGSGTGQVYLQVLCFSPSLLFQQRSKLSD
jgi:hypothetical protein